VPTGDGDDIFLLLFNYLTDLLQSRDKFTTFAAAEVHCCFNHINQLERSRSECSMKFEQPKILSQKLGHRAWRALPKRALIAVGVLLALPVFGTLTAFGVASDTQLDRIERREMVQLLALPKLAEAETESADEQTFMASDRVQRGDSVASLLQRLNVRDSAAFSFLRTEPAARSIFQLRPGRTVQAVTDADGELSSLRYLHSSDQYLEVKRDDDNKFTAQELKLQPTAQTVFRSGTIKSSLFGATDEAGIPDAIATQIARIFSTDVDFHIDLRRGDKFSVVYEMLYHDGEYLRPGRVMSAEFINAGKKFQAFLFSDPEGGDSYFSADGQNRAKGFLRSPLEFSRVSSGFGARFHPIMRNWRAHNGVDFAAPRGTPIWATADGIVEFAGVKGGYGNVIEIRHQSGVTTLYGHMTSFAANARKGARVSQGQTIGYVGATGWATGPHLHYEFKIAGAHQDPLKVALPKADPLPAQYRQAFMRQSAIQVEQLALVREAAFSRFE
jgi:murein DD-endopeptidase MepM/ murein hydrolase activator NlpD